jgi:hypothetical protein
MYICKGGWDKIEGQHYICTSNAPLDLGFHTVDSVQSTRASRMVADLPR